MFPRASTALQIAAENFPPGDVARSESGELSKDADIVFVHQRKSQVSPGKSDFNSEQI